MVDYNHRNLTTLRSLMFQVVGHFSNELDEYASRLFERSIRDSWRILVHLVKNAQPHDGPAPTRFDPAEVAALVYAAPSPAAATKARGDFFRFHFCPSCHKTRTGIRDVADRPCACPLCLRKAEWMARSLLPLAGLEALIG